MSAKERRGCGTEEESHPPDVHQLGPEARRPEGIKVLGSPTVGEQLARELLQTRIAEEQRLWDAIPRFPYLLLVGISFFRAPVHEPTT